MKPRAKNLFDEWIASVENSEVMRASELWRLTERTGRSPFSSRLLDNIATDAGIPELRNRGRAIPEVQVPQGFSFIDDPDLAMDALWEFVQVARQGHRQVSIDQSHCEDIDLCAGSVLNVLALDTQLRLKTGFRGRFPDDPLAREIVIATGLPHVLQLDLPEMEHFKSFDLRRGGSKRSSLLRSSPKERVADELTTYVTRIFETKRFTFSPEGKYRLGQLVGEVLGNAEDHAPGREWWACGYLRQPKAQDYGDCHITLFNFGPTLADTLSEMHHGDDRRDAESLVAQHVQTDRRLTAEGIWTLLALQEGMTRHLGERGNQRRGFGTADMIEAFQLLGGTITPGNQPSMCLVSGRTQIRFDSRFPLAIRTDPTGPRRIIAFNEANDLAVPPHIDAVRTLRNRFPGTLLSLRFFVDPNYLKAIGDTYGTTDG